MKWIEAAAVAVAVWMTISTVVLLGGFEALPVEAQTVLYFGWLASFFASVGLFAVAVARSARVGRPMTFKRAVLLLIVAAMGADLLSFYLMEHMVWAGDQELNPVMRWAYLNLGGMAGVVAFKIALTATILVLVSRLERRWMLASASALAIFFGLLGAAGNTIAWVHCGCG